MIFRQVPEIAAGTKTQTRRIVKPGEVFVPHENGHVVLTPGGRVKLRVGQDYAVQPGRGYHGVYYDIDTGVIYGHDHEPLNDATRACEFIPPLRIRILSLRYPKRLQDMSEADAIAEGVGSVAEYAVLWNSINKLPGTRWDDNPMVWVIKFEVAR